MRGDDFAARAGGDVNVVVADRNRGGDAQVRRAVEQFVVYFFREQAYERILTSDAGQQFVTGRPRLACPIIHFEMLFEQGARRREESMCGEYFWLHDRGPR